MEKSDFSQEKKELLLRISELKKQLLWYKRTYEENDLLGIIYEKIVSDKIKERFRKKNATNGIVKKRVKINKTSNQSFISKKVLCTIVNHDHNGLALTLSESLVKYFDTVVLDSGSTNPPHQFIRFPNIYYSGLLNAAYSIAAKYGYEYLFFICSDVIIPPQHLSKLHDRLLTLDFNKIGLYSPCSSGEGHFFCKRQTVDNLRIVPFVEGFIFLCDMKILSHFCPVNTKDNLYGWGLDIAKGFFAKKMNLQCVIDDSVEVEHLRGTGYPREIAEYEMLSWIQTLKNGEMRPFFEEQLAMLNKHPKS